eukprot:XP_001702870.1 predicted protein [Chlamydomonas reinhardtii]
MADETGIVKQAVLEFLKTADMNVTTERTVLNHLAATLQLSQEVKAYKAVVSATIDDYLSALDDAEDEEEAAEQEEKDGEDAPTQKGLSMDPGQGTYYLGLREYYEKDGQLLPGKKGKDGQKLPGKKGIALAPADWATMCAALPAISSALAKRDMGYVLQLSGKRRVSLSEFKGAVYVGVREFYEKDGQLLPGAKGLSMNAAQWAALVAGAPGFNAALQSQE